MDAVKHVLEASHLRNEPQVDPNMPPVSVTSELVRALDLMLFGGYSTVASIQEPGFETWVGAFLSVP